MIRYIITFFVLAIVSGALGLSGMASSFSWVAQVLTVLFVVLLGVSVLMNVMGVGANQRLI